MSSVNIYGVVIRYVRPRDIIEPNDHNSKLDALWKIHYELESLSRRIKELEEKVGA